VPENLPICRQLYIITIIERKFTPAYVGEEVARSVEAVNWFQSLAYARGF